MNDHWGNCLTEVIKAKLQHGKNIKVIFIPPWKNEVFCPHFMWHDLRDNNLYDFHSPEPLKSAWHEVWFKGCIRVRPYAVYERWLKTKQWT